MAKPLNLESFAWACSAFCQLNRIPFDGQFLLRQFPPPYSSVNLQQALNHLGFDSHIKKRTLSKLQAASLPCIDVVAPFGDREGVIEDARKTVFNNAAVSAILLQRDGTVQVADYPASAA